MQVMAKNHLEGSLQNLGICVKKGNPVFKKGNPASKGQVWPSGDLRGKCCLSIAKICIFEKGTVSPARDERDIDFDCIYTVFESGGVPSTR